MSSTLFIIFMLNWWRVDGRGFGSLRLFTYDVLLLGPLSDDLQLVLLCEVAGMRITSKSFSAGKDRSAYSRLEQVAASSGGVQVS